MSKIRLAALPAPLYSRLRRTAWNLRTCLTPTKRRPTGDVVEVYRRALDTMAEEQRMVFLMHLREELSIIEIANRLARPSDEVERLLALAIVHLSAAMSAAHE